MTDAQDPKRLPAPRMDGLSVKKEPVRRSCDGCGRFCECASIRREPMLQICQLCEECRLQLYHLLGRLDRPDARTE